MCFNFMPVEAETYPEGVYRWSPYEDELIQQVGYVSDPFGEIWRPLPSVALLSAVNSWTLSLALSGFVLSVLHF